MKAYDKYKLPKELGTARVNLLTPLTFFHDGLGKTMMVNSNCYGFVIVDSGVMVARGES